MGQFGTDCCESGNRSRSRRLPIARATSPARGAESREHRRMRRCSPETCRCGARFCRTPGGAEGEGANAEAFLFEGAVRKGRGVPIQECERLARVAGVEGSA